MEITLKPHFIKIEYIRIGNKLYPALMVQSDEQNPKTFHIGTEKTYKADRHFDGTIDSSLIFTGSHEDIIKACTHSLSQEH